MLFRSQELVNVTAPVPPVIHIAFINTTFSLIWGAAGFFYDAFLQVETWWVVGPLFATICLFVHNILWNLLTPIAHFGEWADEIANKVSSILTTSGILGLILSWFPWLDGVAEWFYNRWTWFATEVGSWWDTTRTMVLGWIAVATEGLDTLKVLWDEFWLITWPEWSASLEVLAGEVTDFFTHTLPGLVDDLKLETWWRGKIFIVNGLIGSKLLEWFPFYDDLVEIWSDILEFF